MTIKLDETYVGRVDTTDTDYQWGKGRNIQGGVPNTGTPFDEKWFNDFEGNKQALLRIAGIVPSGVSDSAVNSDQLEAMKRVQRGFLVGNPIGSFKYGFEYTSTNDVGIDNDGNFWKYSGVGSYPITVAADTDPTSGDFVQAYARDGQINPVGNFADGVTFNFPNDAARDAGGEYWVWTGALPYTATAGTIPSSPDYEKVFYNSASNVNTNDGKTAQDTHNTVKAILVSEGLSGEYGFFADGFTINGPLDVGINASYQFWKYVGTETLPYAVPQGTDPTAGDWELVFLNDHSRDINRNAVGAHDDIYTRNFKSVTDLRNQIDATGATIDLSLLNGSKVFWRGYYQESDGGSNWGVVKTGDSTTLTDDGGSIFIIVNDATDGVWIEANLKGKSVNVLKWGMKGDNAESSSAINTIQKDRLLAYCSSNAGIIKLPDGIFRINTPWVPSALDQSLKGDSSLGSRLVASDTFVGEAVFHVDNFTLRTKLTNIFLSGNNITDCIRITDGGLGHIEDVQLKFGNAGLRLIKGNGWRGFNVYAESCVDAYVVEPSATNDTNDTFMRGLRAFNCSGWGLDVKESASAGQGHMHSSWEVSIENCGNGVRVAKGRNVEYTMYVEGIAGTYWDLDHTVGNDYICKNPDGEETGLFGEFSVSKGTDYKGVELLTDKGVDIERVRSVSGGNINLIGRVKNYILTNTAGAVRMLTLTQMAYERVGYRMNLYKDGSTSGFTIAAPAGYTLIGDTAVSFGVNLAASAEAIKISSTEIFLKVNNS